MLRRVAFRFSIFNSRKLFCRYGFAHPLTVFRVSPHKFAAVLSHTIHTPSTSTEHAAMNATETSSPLTETNSNLAGINPPRSTIDIPTTTVEPKSPIKSTRPLPRRQSTYSIASMPAPAHPLKILLVEDNEINLSLLVKCISSLQHQFATATNGREAVDAFASQGPFDVVILDIQMPIMDGFAATREIRKVERKEEKSNRLENRQEGESGSVKKGRATIIALTGASSVMAKQEAFAAGIDLYLVKPVSMKSLRDVLAGIESGGSNVEREDG